MSGTPLTQEASAQPVFTSGLKLNAFHVADGRRIRIGMPIRNFMDQENEMNPATAIRRCFPLVARFVILAALLTVSICSVSQDKRHATNSNVGRDENEAQAEIDRFNHKFVALHLKMDHAGILAMWADDGVDLMPGENPLVGKKAITAWVEDIQSKMGGHTVVKEELQFHDLHISGNWASEWATEDQAVQMPDGKPPVEGYGKIALVLNREPSGEWKIKQEMWNDAPRP
jgi:ketosteroid isomerase-like protein